MKNLPPFYIGQKVVCVAEFNTASTSTYNEQAPKKDEVYTVRYIDFDGGYFYIRLKEIVNKERLYISGFGECKFNANKFVPLEHTFKPIEYTKVIEQQLVSSN